MKLDHLQLAIPAGAEDKCRQFWGTVLGFDEVAKPPELQGRGGVWFVQGSTEIHLGIEPDFTPAKKAHPAFRVEDLDQLADRLASAGFPAIWDDQIKGRRRFFSQDAVGNRIEFIEE